MNTKKLSSIVEDVLLEGETYAIIILQEAPVSGVYDVEFLSPRDAILRLKTFEAINPNWRDYLSAELVCTIDNNLIFVQIGHFFAARFAERQLQNLRIIYPLSKTEENLAKFPEVSELLSKILSD